VSSADSLREHSIPSARSWITLNKTSAAATGAVVSREGESGGRKTPAQPQHPTCRGGGSFFVSLLTPGS